MTIICVLILFPLLTFASLIPAPFPACIYPRVLLLLIGLEFRLFDSEVYYRALSVNFPTRARARFDQAGNKSSVASKLLLHTYTWVQMVKAKERWGVRKKKKSKGKKDERGRTSKGDRWWKAQWRRPEGRGPARTADWQHQRAIQKFPVPLRFFR